jgi:AcrR family transcriptional regulator
MRTDAKRNRDKIITVARAAFADSDADVSMAEISRRAGVGMATLYRNFPGRRDLLEALYTEEVDAICRAAGTPGTSLASWLRQLFVFFAGKRYIASELLKHADSGDLVFRGGRARVIAAGQPLLAAAQQAGEIREDLGLEQVLDLIHAIAAIHGDTSYVEPILQTALDGLRPGKLWPAQAESPQRIWAQLAALNRWALPAEPVGPVLRPLSHHTGPWAVARPALLAM